MRKRARWISFWTFICTTALLYAAGHAFTIQWLMYRHEYMDQKTGFYVHTGSLAPAVIGVLAGLIAERIYVYQER
ncbi:hypothetical protein [Ectobacillus ponti]|uniref:Uncharacterized protein n=1 Tax=Ectobacillus ponti TaxID=2961894 RepID=A0AA41X6D9_9BACI|nr:hypothetical protein [Ectobacillus ponti]MCP8969786.1 hypothetical protein [Ectobacillus ponti]